jgi:acetyl esterase/lipase
MIVGGCDILLEDNMAMAARLSAAGVDIDLRIYPESPHGFTFHPTTMARIVTQRHRYMACRTHQVPTNVTLSNASTLHAAA